jgi:hypothetical protein
VFRSGQIDDRTSNVLEEELVWSGGRGWESAKPQLIAAVLDKEEADTFCVIHKIRRNVGDSLHRERVAQDWRGSRSGFPSPEAAIRVRFVLRGLANGLMGTADVQIPTAANPGGSSR